MTAPKPQEVPEWFLEYKKSTQNPQDWANSWKQNSAMATAAFRAGLRAGLERAAKRCEYFDACEQAEGGSHGGECPLQIAAAIRAEMEKT